MLSKDLHSKGSLNVSASNNINMSSETLENIVYQKIFFSVD